MNCLECFDPVLWQQDQQYFPSAFIANNTLHGAISLVPPSIQYILKQPHPSPGCVHTLPPTPPPLPLIALTLCWWGDGVWVSGHHWCHVCDCHAWGPPCIMHAPRQSWYTPPSFTDDPSGHITLPDPQDITNNQSLYLLHDETGLYRDLEWCLLMIVTFDTVILVFICGSITLHTVLFHNNYIPLICVLIYYSKGDFQICSCIIIGSVAFVISPESISWCNITGPIMYLHDVWLWLRPMSWVNGWQAMATFIPNSILCADDLGCSWGRAVFV